MKTLNIKLYIVLMWLLYITACDRPSIEKYRIPKSVNQTLLNEEVNNLSIGWVKPETWLESSGSKMRLGSYDVPYKEGYADLSIMMLSGTGGGIEANINRWRAQIGLPFQELGDINDSSEDRICQLGSYKVFKLVNPENINMAFLCSIIPSGDNTIFVKLSIASNSIHEVEPDFLEFCDSFKIDYD